MKFCSVLNLETNGLTFNYQFPFILSKKISKALQDSTGDILKGQIKGSTKETTHNLIDIKKDSSVATRNIFREVS